MTARFAPPRQRAETPGERPRRRVPRRVLAGVGLLALLAGVALALWLRPLDAPIPADVGALYAELERGTTPRGFARLGSADAPVVVEEFTSYACPHCREFHQERLPHLRDEIAAGQVQFILIPVPHIGWGADTATKAAWCAGEQGNFWEMTDVLFDWQARFVTSTFAARRVVKGARNLGLDAAAFDACLSADRTDAAIKLARDEFTRRGLSGTPGFFINGQPMHDYAELNNLGELAQHLTGGTS